MRVPTFLVGTLLAAALAVFSPTSRAQPPDVVLLNGKIVTIDTALSVPQALAIRDGKILALGSTADIRALAGPATRAIDLRGYTVVPGLIDSHLHAIRAALSLQHGGELDRGADARGGAAADQRGRENDGARSMAHRRRRLERAAVRGEAPADTSRDRGRRAEQSRVRAARLRLGGDDGGGFYEARHSRRRRLAAGRENRARRRWPLDGRDQRQQRRYRRAVRSAAEADVRAAGGRHEGVLSRAQSPRNDRRDGSGRQQPARRGLSGVVRRVAARRDDRADRL